MENFVDGNTVFGDAIQQMHDDCRNCGVLLGVTSVSDQGGAILAYGNQFCYVLTVKMNSVLRDNSKDLHVTFGDGTDKTFRAHSYDVHLGNNLSIICLRDQIDAVQQAIEFSGQEAVENEVVRTLTYAPRVAYNIQGTEILAAAASLFPGGAVGPSGQVEGEYAFFHNCSAGFDVTEGSTVFNERRECVGMNLQFLPGSTLALQLRAIREEIVEMFPETKDMNFVDIRQHFEALS